MESYLEKQKYVYRRSFKFFFRIGVCLSLSKFIFSVFSITGYFYFPLTLLTLVSGTIELLEKSLKISERTEEYKHAYKFYGQFLNLYKAKKLSETDINLREEELNNNFNFFPREKYLKQAQLNGYKSMETGV